MNAATEGHQNQAGLRAVYGKRPWSKGRPVFKMTLIKTFKSIYMSVDKDFLLTALLQHNYLPTQRKRREELTPISYTTTFFNALAVELAKLPYRTGDVFAMLTLYWAGQHEDLIAAYCSGLDKNAPYELDRHWALLYQLFFDGVISNPYANDEVFSVLKAHGFSLFDNAVDPALFGFEAIDGIDASAQPS